ncbi:transposase [Thermoleptolyngbya sichuanensis]|uniref:transposase n=1 Tax=Thermoleptolyngbya sichuanensis TaxID=2885951 RepID=UPI003527B3D2
MCNISDEELEDQVSDRLSFMQFTGFSLSDEVGASHFRENSAKGENGRVAPGMTHHDT